MMVSGLPQKPADAYMHEHSAESGSQPRRQHVCARVPVVELRDISVRLGGNDILSGVTMHVCRGTMHAIIGPNGGGKTTLLKAVLGQVPHTGNIYLRLKPGGAIGYVPQFVEFDRDMPMTVEDFLAVSRREYPGSRGALERSLQSLAEVNGENLISKQLGTLSGGEMRRVLLAQALEPMPDLLLLDEAAAGVDEAGRRLFNERLRHICGEHEVSILMITHDLEAVREFCHLVTCINRRVLFEGEPQQTLTLENMMHLFSTGGKASTQ